MDQFLVTAHCILKASERCRCAPSVRICRAGGGGWTRPDKAEREVDRGPNGAGTAGP